MPKCEDVVNQLRAVLPSYTDKFNASVNITAWSRVDSTITITTDEDILLTSSGLLGNGSYVNIGNVLTENPVVSISVSGTTATCEVSNIHDLTENFEMTVKFKDIPTDGWDEDFELLTVPTQTGFTFEVPSGIATPDITSAVLLENRYSFNGYYELTALGNKTYTYELPEYNASIPTTADLTDAKVLYGLRISGADWEDNIKRFFTKQPENNFWMFAIIGDTVASKSRQNDSDSIAKFQEASRYEQEIIQSLVLYVFIPQSSSKITARQARDEIEDLRLPILKAMAGHQFSSGLTEDKPYVCVYAGDGFYADEFSYYIHRFEFENTMKINPADTVEAQNTVATRFFVNNFINEFDEFIKTDIANLPT